MHGIKEHNSHRDLFWALSSVSYRSWLVLEIAVDGVIGLALPFREREQVEVEGFLCLRDEGRSYGTTLRKIHQ